MMYHLMIVHYTGCVIECSLSLVFPSSTLEEGINVLGGGFARGGGIEISTNGKRDKVEGSAGYG